MARKKLSEARTAIPALVARMKEKAALKSCESDLKTRPFSDKAKEFASTAITAALKTALDTEFKALGNSGCVADGLPWGHQGYRERISNLEKAQTRLHKKPWPAYPSDTERGEMCQQYDHLRAIIERVVQDVIFNVRSSDIAIG